MYKPILAAASIGAFAVAAVAAPPPSNPGKRAMKTETKAEVAPQTARMFTLLDANKDGFITQAELDARKNQAVERMEKRAAQFDPAKMFARLDTNKDGKATKAEVLAAMNARLAMKGKLPANAPNHAARLFARLDANRDGAITLAEIQAAPRPDGAARKRAGMKHGMGGQLLAKADSNHDGRVSLAEAQQVAYQTFDRADLNHDSKVTPDERAKFHQQMKAARKPG